MASCPMPRASTRPSRLKIPVCVSLKACKSILVPQTTLIRGVGGDARVCCARRVPYRHRRASRTVCYSTSAEGSKKRYWKQEDIDNPEVHSLLKSKAPQFEPLEADERHWETHGQREDASSPPPSGLASQAEKGIPVYVMLPLDTIRVMSSSDGTVHTAIQNEVALEIALHTLREAGVSGVMVDVWWGLVERQAPGEYDFAAYKRLFHKVASAGLKVQAVMSFHAAGSNVGDTCTISLPLWVHRVGDRDPDIFYTDKSGHRNRECLSIGCDHEPVFWGRTPLQLYEGFIRAFVDEFQHLFGDVVGEITLGCGPAGELRYPAYPEGDRRWRFPGVGEFQCYDRYMLADLKAWADACDKPQWGLGGPHDAGGYCYRAEHTGFFHPEWGSWKSDYGHFFLSWYSQKLIDHAAELLDITARVLAEPGRPRQLSRVERASPRSGLRSLTFKPSVKLGIKLAGVHWCYRTPSHAAEVTAGYYNAAGHDGYAPIFQLVKRHGGSISFTCVEMRDCEHPPESACSPEGLLRQIIKNAEAHEVPLTGENALQRYDHHGLRRIKESAIRDHAENGGYLSQLTFLRMGHLMFDHWGSFTHLVSEMARLHPHHCEPEPLPSYCAIECD